MLNLFKWKKRPELMNCHIGKANVKRTTDANGDSIGIVKRAASHPGFLDVALARDWYESRQKTRKIKLRNVQQAII
jgi:hypothetical protein